MRRFLLVALGALGAPQLALAAPHGALDMAAQEQALDALHPAAPGAVPEDVDPFLWRVLVPGDNPVDAAKVALGRKLYFDPRLSADGSVSCATCHDVSRGFTDQRMASEGIHDQVGRRNAPTTLNAALFATQFWDGRAPTLEAQAALPILNPIEMGNTKEGATKAIEGDAEYIAMFEAAYGREPNFDDAARAIATFERTLIFLKAPFDRYMAGDAASISDDAKAGWALFNGKARCASCHPINDTNPIGSDNLFHNIGVSARSQNFEALAKDALGQLGETPSIEHVEKLALESDMSELGRFVVTRNRSDIGAFKTQQLRNIGITAPYMHNGSLTTLWDVVDHYNKGGEANLYLDGGVEPLNLSEREIDQLVAFLFTLTDARFAEANGKAEAGQRARAAKQRPFRDTAVASRERIQFEDRVLGKK